MSAFGRIDSRLSGGMSDPQKRKPKRVQDQTFQRLYSIESFEKRMDGEGDDAKEIYRFKLSSDKPIEVYPGELEILSHERDAVDMSFLDSGSAPLLWMHRRDDYRGVIEKADLEDGFIFVEVRFGTRENAQELKNDVDAGIIKNVSIGYRMLEWKLTESKEDGPDVWTITKWRALEGSFVTIPADENVGMGRSRSFKDLLSGGDQPEAPKEPSRSQQPTTKPMPATVTDEPKKPAVDKDALRSEGAKAERQRVQYITDIASRTKGYDLAKLRDDAIANDESIEKFRSDVMEHIASNSPKLDQFSAGANPKEAKRYDISKVIEGLRSGNLEKHAGYELEMSDELKKRTGKGGDTIAIPSDVVLRGWVPKDQSAVALVAAQHGISARDLQSVTLTGAGQSNSSSNIVDTELLNELFVYSLREDSALLDSGVTIIPGLVGNVEIPVELLNPLFYWIGEDEEPTEGNYGLGKVGLNFRTVGSQIPWTRQADKQTQPGIAGLLTRSCRKGAALALANLSLIHI